MKKHCVFHEVVTEFVYIVYVIFKLESGMYLFILACGVLGAFAELRKEIVSFVICPSVRPHGTTRLPLDGFL
jgi:hypothetical protein